MSVTLQELIDRSVLQAKRAMTAAPPNLELTAAALVPQIFQEVGRDMARDERTRSLLMTPKTVSFTNGVGALSADVLTRYKADSSLRDTADEETLYSLVPVWDDFAAQVESPLGRYHITDGDSIYVVEPDEIFEEGAGLTGSRALRIPCAPQVPATASTAIDAREEVTDALLNALAAALVGRSVEVAA